MTSLHPGGAGTGVGGGGGEGDGGGGEGGVGGEGGAGGEGGPGTGGVELPLRKYAQHAPLCGGPSRFPAGQRRRQQPPLPSGFIGEKLNASQPAWLSHSASHCFTVSVAVAPPWQPVFGQSLSPYVPLTGPIHVSFAANDDAAVRGRSRRAGGGERHHQLQLSGE